MQSMDLSEPIRELSHDDRLDAGRAALQRVADAIPADLRPILRGDWLGHRAHPMLTDLPVGFWTSAGVLDLVGGRRGAPAAQRLVALGLMSVPLAAATGITDWREMPASTQRVGVVHAGGNVAASLLYLLSWKARRRGQRGRGVLFGMAGMGVATLAGALGGHLAFGEDAPTTVDLDALGDGHRDATADEVRWATHQ